MLIFNVSQDALCATQNPVHVVMGSVKERFRECPLHRKPDCRTSQSLYCLHVTVTLPERLQFATLSNFICIGQVMCVSCAGALLCAQDRNLGNVAQLEVLC